MSDTGAFSFPGNLDPRAREYRPGSPNDEAPRFLIAPTHLYYPYPYPPPPPPLAPLPYVAQNQGQLVPIFTPQSGHGPVRYPAHGGAYFTVAAAAAQPPQLPCLSSAPTRSLMLSSVPSGVSEAVMRRAMEVFGEVRGVQVERASVDGVATVHFYDLRDAERALNEIRDQHVKQQALLRSHFMNLTLGDSGGGDLHAPTQSQARGLVAGRAVWAQFVVPAINAVADGNNQGTIVVFHLDPGVSSDALRDIFRVYGPVKELRETPYKKHQRFVEFFDVRDAAKALAEMNGKEIHGKQVVIEFSRPGGFSKKFFDSSNYRSNASSSAILRPPHPLPLPGVHNRPHYPSQSYLKKLPKSSFNENPSNGSAMFLGKAPSSSYQRKMAKKSLSEVSHGHKQRYRITGGSGCKLWKNRHSKNVDSQFFISDAMEDSGPGDSRTTVMIKNIPNKYSQKLLLNMLDNHCIHCNEQIADQGRASDQPPSSYDFVYLPIDFNNKCNVGYGFVNMTSPQAAWRLYKAFHNQHWEVFNSKKICEVTYARVQGLEALKEHFKNSKFPCEAEHYLPVVFSPPRDGRQLTDPVPIADHFRHEEGRNTTGSAASDRSASSTSRQSQSPHENDPYPPSSGCASGESTPTAGCSSDGGERGQR